MPLNIILVECGLEIIPKEIRKHPSVKKNINRNNYSSQLLDNALHHSAIRRLPNFLKRGRPDILHACLLNALGSPANKSGNLRIFVHTTLNRLFEFNPKIRITRNYNRFKGLMAKMLIDRTIQSKDIDLISEIRDDLSVFINKIQPNKIFLCTSKGKLISDYSEIFQSNSLEENYVVIIGGFQKGYFSKKIIKIALNLISISEFPLDAWIVVSKIITYYEIICGIV